MSQKKPKPPPGLCGKWDGLDGFSTSQGPTFDGGYFYGGGPQRQRSLSVRALSEQGQPTTIQVDLTDGTHHGCSVSLTPTLAREVAAGIIEAADKADADRAHWQAVLDKMRNEMNAAALRDAEARVGGG